MYKANIARWSIFGLLFSTMLTVQAQESLEHAIETQVNTDSAARQSQQQIDNLVDETTDLLTEYREVLRQTQSLRAYNEQLEQLVNSQQQELQSIDEQLINIETTQRDIVPLMMQMIEVMAQFVELDAPFLPAERQERVVQLQALMSRADVSLAEKYRRILEAYQVETEYGRTIEAYQGTLDVNGQSRTVDFLRMGRVGLYYLTLDGMEAGVWDHEAGQWQRLPNQFTKSVDQGLKVARRQLPPDLLVLPVKAVERAE
ncbi:DUF3450 domain-containing protein [Methylophaga lonarensis]|uniref:DUF3450 domain-containing protein n=1 Tax=Methylophaga lonarensis TaxID=999151 RepID=UPI003D2C22FD